MASERDRILELRKYIESQGISINIAKNKARGNKGVFIRKSNVNRIDISKDLTEKEQLSVLIHEFAHYVHYKYDKTLKSLNFIFGDYDDAVTEELQSITVDCIPKEFAESLFKQKEEAKSEIKNLTNQIKETFSDFRASEPYKRLENGLRRPIKYLLSYDNIRFFNKVYSVNNLCELESNLTPCELYYIKLKSKQRLVNRINSRMSKLNKYYNNPSELFARFMESLMLNPERTEKIAPLSTTKFKTALKNNTVKELTGFVSFFPEILIFN